MDDLLNEVQQIIEQRSSAWYQIRLGRFTASEIWKLLTEPRSKADKEAGVLSDTAQTYILDKVAETLTGFSKDFTDEAMAWGIQNENLAKEWYLKITGEEIKEAPFIEYGLHAGGSSDGFIGKSGMIEIKCPYVTSNHLHHCLADTQEKFKEGFSKYYTQIQANLLFADRDFCDFVSFDPRIQSDIAYYRLRIETDHLCQQTIRARVEQAIKLKQEYLEQFAKYSLEIKNAAA